jgi:methionine S-methyltransferase
MSLSLQVDEFLACCRQSSQQAFTAFSKLLASLESPDTRKEARQFLSSLHQAWMDKTDRQEDNFSFITQSVKTYNGERRDLLLLLFPSVFAPEEWSFTFYEGLLRYPTSEFYSSRVVELGCGSGWITLALALYSLPKIIYGVDLNPKAIACSQINLYLNALDAEGEPILDSERLTLLDRVKFAESDLLKHFFSNSQPLDRIIGCIPQVLNPELEVIQDLAHHSASDEFLHSLSNYCEKQGYVEDRFGLGLLAKAVEQSIQLLRPTGKVILNFGGRPGASVLERLLTRRGLTISQIWQTRVEQDPDTDISSLVEIERATDHRFEFFMTPRSNVPIGASTAKVYSESGGKIFHTVSVYEGTLAYPTWLKQIFAVLQNREFEEVKAALDLTETDAEIAEERFFWLASLLNYLDTSAYFPYGFTEGEEALRDRIATYFRNYHSLPWTTKNLVISPSREEIIANLLNLYNPDKILIDEGLRQLIPNYWHDRDRERIIEAPRRVSLVCQLMENLKPSLVITGLQDFEIEGEEPFDILVTTAQKLNILLIVDISDNLHLSSHPNTNGLFEYLSVRQISERVIILGDLIKNRLYPDLSLCFVVNNSFYLQQDLIRAAELTYSRVSLITQFFYQQLLEQLLYFQTPRVENNITLSHTDSLTSFSFKKARSAEKAFTHPAIQENELPFTDSTIRLDYGENCLPTSPALKRAIAEAFVRQDLLSEELDLHIPLSLFLSKRYRITSSEKDNFVYGGGVASLFKTVVEECCQNRGNFLFPQGAYGYFRAVLEFYDVPVQIIEGDEARGFKLDLASLETSLKNTANPWLYLNAPLVNPTGVLYGDREIKEIVELAWQYNTRVVIDTVFSGLEFEPHSSEIDFSSIAESKNTNTGDLILLGGISKEFAAAGVRFAYLYSPNKTIVKQLKQRISKPLPQTTSYAMRRFYEQLTKDEGELRSYRQSQCESLARRAKQLVEVLQQSGWTPITPQGGLFLVAKPSTFLGKTLAYEREGKQIETIINGDTITKILFDRANLAINSATWTGIPNYCRFVLSGSESEFQEALTRIKNFGAH